MPDLREALRRASGITETESPDHNWIESRTRNLVRRRRITYAAVSTAAVIVVAFSGFQIAEGNWFQQTQPQDDITVSPSAPAVIHVLPKNPLEGDRIFVRVENIGDADLTVDGEFRLVSLELEDTSTTTDSVERVISPGATSDRELLIESVPAGTFHAVATVTGASGDSREITRIFTVDPAPTPIEVSAPRPGNTLSSPFPVSGTADVYEGTVQIRVRDQDGRAIVETFTTATCGNGCRGNFSDSIEYQLDSKQQGVVEFFWISAETGEEEDLIAVPVTLMPSNG